MTSTRITNNKLTNLNNL